MRRGPGHGGMSGGSDATGVDGKAEVWITGIGLVSSLGNGAGANWQRLAGEARSSLVCPVIDEGMLAPYPVHPLADADLSTYVPKKSDLRQMGRWQQIGVHAAGLALADAGLLGNAELLGATDLNVAAGNGERDIEADRTILTAVAANDGPDGFGGGATLNAALQRSIRPTLYLTLLSNLLAGNISIVHGVAGSSRTFKGEEMAGVAAVQDAVHRIETGQSRLFLAGGALNAERSDLALVYELAGGLWRGPYRSVWQRGDGGGGFVMGSVGAFLVLEAASHARARGRVPYARLSAMASARAKHMPAGCDGAMSEPEWLGPVLGRLAGGTLPVLSGATGVEPATTCEREWLARLGASGHPPRVRAYGSVLGHAVEAHFTAGLALAAMAVREHAFYPPFDTSAYEQPCEEAISQVLVTASGQWRGKGLALVETASGS